MQRSLTSTSFKVKKPSYQLRRSNTMDPAPTNTSFGSNGGTSHNTSSRSSSKLIRNQSITKSDLLKSGKRSNKVRASDVNVSLERERSQLSRRFNPEKERELEIKKEVNKYLRRRLLPVGFGLLFGLILCVIIAVIIVVPTVVSVATKTDNTTTSSTTAATTNPLTTVATTTGSTTVATTTVSTTVATTTGSTTIATTTGSTTVATTTGSTTVATTTGSTTVATTTGSTTTIATTTGSTTVSTTTISTTMASTSASTTVSTSATTTVISSTTTGVTATTTMNVSNTSVSTTAGVTTTTATTVTITPNTCTSMWTGIHMIASCVSCTYSTTYTQYNMNYTAISSSTYIVFALQRQTDYFALDEVSVTNYASPGVQLLSNGDFEMGNLTSWVYCDQNNASNTGGVESNGTFISSSFVYTSEAGDYFYVGGGPSVADYLSQEFATVVGDIYNISLWVMTASTGTTSMDIFLAS